MTDMSACAAISATTRRARNAVAASLCAGLLAACTPGESRREEGANATQSGAPALATTAPAPTAPAPLASPATAAASGRESRYTRLRGCRVVDKAAPGEGDWSASACPGLAGFRLRLTDDDLRQSLIVTPPGGGEHGLKLSEATRSGGFSRIGDTIEWRGTGEGETFRPDALILRYLVAETPDTPQKETAYLLAVSLAAKPCVTAKLAPGRDQNERARAAADGKGRCLA